MQFPQTLADWTGILSNPLFGAFIVFMVFRVLNRQSATVFGKVNLSILAWSDFAKIVFALVLTLGWSALVGLLDKSYVSMTPDTIPLIISRGVAVWGGNQAVYLGLVKALGPVGSKFFTGGATPGELINDALNPTPDPVLVMAAKG